MKTKRPITLLTLLFLIVLCFQTQGQVNKPKDVAKQQGTSRINSKIDQGIDEGFNKVEEGIGNLFKKKKDNANEADESDDAATGDENSESDDIPVQTSQKPKLESATQYDFVPGDVILYFDDFSQDAVGDYPALWSSNSSGEVKTVNIAPGHWFHMNGEDAVYCYTKQISFPDNFIIEFDIIPDEEYNYGSTLTLYQDDPDDPKELNDDLYPGIAGLHITMDKERWETKGYKVEEDWISGQGSKNPVIREEVNHVIIWIQKRRVRIYHKGAKTIDMPTNIYEGTKFNRLRFSGWDANSWPMISNLKITTAAPDTRSKLITEGKLVTYGITFDVNKADIKPEAYGTLKDIATVLKENPDVRIKIVGHTDSDGKDDLNLDLSARRALAVKSELAKTFGIDASRMETEGAGETQALAPNDSPENKAKNRRVELIKL